MKSLVKQREEQKHNFGIARKFTFMTHKRESTIILNSHCCYYQTEQNILYEQM